MPQKLTQEEFIEKCKKKFGGKYDYSECDFINVKTKVIITCPEHGTTEQTPKSHLKGNGCGQCAKDKERLTLNQFIQKSIDKHGDKYDYKEIIYVNISTKVKIYCKKCENYFYQEPNNHLKGHGCKKCSINSQKNTVDGFIKTPQKFIKSNGQYKYYYVKSNGTTQIQRGISKSKFINNAILKHGNLHDYSYVDYIHSRIEILIVCKIHGCFFQTPTGHLKSNGNGCPKCGKDMKTENDKLSFGEFIKRATKSHDNKYKYSNYSGMKYKLTIECPDHGLFDMRCDAHISGQECPKCALINISSSFAKTKDQFIIDAINVHGDKYDYSLVEYINNATKLIIICKTHGQFSMVPNDHISHRGNCPNCFSVYSKKSIEWLNYVSKNENINIQHAENGGEKSLIINNKKYRVDGWCDKTNTVYEFAGSLWHAHPLFYDPEDLHPIKKIKNKEIYEKTLQKENTIKNSGYNLIVMWEHDWNKIKKELDK